MKLGLYVGSFNPVHKDHIWIATGLIEKQIVDKVLFVSTMDYWDKKNLTNIKHRINMLKLFANENILIDEKRNAYEYTYQVIEDLKKEYTEAEIFLIIGADNVEKFHLWNKVDEILQNKVIVIKRTNLEIERYINEFAQKDQFIVVDLHTKGIAGTDIRAKIKNGEPLNDLLDQKVINYIQAENLYKGN